MTVMETTILVVDVEATCSDHGEISPDEMEIIEIGACWALSDGTLIDEFRTFVRPVQNPVLTPFCLSLTGIQQVEVDGAQPFAGVVTQLAEFVAQYSTQNSFWMSWGSYDFTQFARDSEQQKVANPLLISHQNAKQMFAKSQKIGKQVGLAKACELTRLGMIGSHHRALDDARNVVRLLPWVFGTRTIRASSP